MAKSAIRGHQNMRHFLVLHSKRQLQSAQLDHRALQHFNHRKSLVLHAVHPVIPDFNMPRAAFLGSRDFCEPVLCRKNLKHFRGDQKALTLRPFPVFTSEHSIVRVFRVRQVVELPYCEGDEGALTGISVPSNSDKLLVVMIISKMSDFFLRSIVTI